MVHGSKTWFIWLPESTSQMASPLPQPFLQSSPMYSAHKIHVWRDAVVRTSVLASELSLSCARPEADA